MAKDRIQDDKTLPPQATDGPANNKKRRSFKVRKVDDDLKAMNKIDALLESFTPNSALRILGYCTDKQKERFINGTTPPSNPFDPRSPGGPLYTPTLPGMHEEARG